MFLLEAPGKNLLLCLLQVLEPTDLPCLVTCSPSSSQWHSIFQSLLSDHALVVTSFWFWLILLSHNVSCDDVGPTQLTQDHLPSSESLTTAAESLLPCKMTWRFYGLGGGHLWGRASQAALVVKNPPANAHDVRDVVQSLGQEDPLKEIVATLSSILAWRIPQTEEPGGLQSIGSHRVGHDWSDLTCTHTSLGEKWLFCWSRMPFIISWIMFALGLPCSAPAFSSVKRGLLSSCRAQASHCNSSGTQLHPKTDSWSCSELWEAGRLPRRRKEGNPVGFQVWLEDRGQGFLRKGPTWVVGDAFPCPASWILANPPLRGITFLICVLSLVHENIVFFTCRSRKKIGIQRCLGIEGALTEEVELDVEKVMGRQGWGSIPVTSTRMRYGEGLEWSY